MRANNESLSNLRLYTDDKIANINNTAIENNCLAHFLLNAGFATPVLAGGPPASLQGIKVTRALKVRLIAVGWSASSAAVTGQTGGVTLEFFADGNSFNISDRSVKPVRTRVPQKNYILNQWIDVAAGEYGLTDTIKYSLGELTWNKKLFTCDGSVNFVDIAVRF